MRPGSSLLALLLALGAAVAPSGAVEPPAPSGHPASGGATTAPPGAPEVPPAAFFPESQITPGLRGVARTVFEGDRVEDFEVEFLGVLKNAIGPQQDMILARLHGPKVEFTGVVAGMSGSPVYVDGRLVGALSYRMGSFAKEPIAGITPIGDMLRVAEPGGRPRAVAALRPGDLLSRLHADLGGSPASAPGAGSPFTPAASSGGLEPIATPLVCSGCDAGVLAYYAPAFEAMGITPAAGGGSWSGEPAAGGAKRPPLPIEPGTAIGAALATGDLNLSAIGTLTHVSGNRVFAFGHPMTGLGETAIPMTQAEVLVTLASAAGSFKIANSTEPIGTIVEDRLTAIMGKVGQAPPTLPLTVRVRLGETRRDFHYNVVRDRAFSPTVVGIAAANSLVRANEFNASSTLAMRYRLDVEGYPELRYEDLYSGTNPNQPVHLSAANDMAALLNLVLNNPFEEPKVRSAEADLEALEPTQVAVIHSVWASRSDVRPGDSLRVVVTLSPYRGPDRNVSFEVVIPEDTPSGDLPIIVAGGSALDGLDRRVIERQISQAASLADVLRLVGRQRDNHTLYLRVARRAPSAIVRSEILPDLPLSIFSVLNNPRLSADTTLLLEAPLLETGRDIGLVTIGGRRVSIKVR